MGRFSDLWATGKFIAKDREETEKSQQQEALHMFQDLSPEMAVPESTRQIFDALKARRGAETGKWLREMAPDQSLQVEAQRQQMLEAGAPTSGSFEDTVAWMDGLFKEFADLAYEFNKTAVGTELLISFERPSVTEKRSDEVWYRPVSKTYQGRVTTRRWAMIIKGVDKKISIFLLPSGVLLSFTSGKTDEKEYPPFVELIHTADGEWTIGGVSVGRASTGPLAKELLGDIIRVSSGVMSEAELFTQGTDSPKLGENTAVGYAQPETPRATAEHVDSSAMDMHDACDVVDHVIDRELKRLYAEASSLQASSPNAEVIRKQISAATAFRMKMLEAFEQYIHACQATPSATPQQSNQFDLQR
jgi:hypothetical protein